MKLHSKILIGSVFLSLVFASCGTKSNKNVTVPEQGLDSKIPNFFNAVGLPLKEMDADDSAALQADLSRVAKAFVNEMPGEKSLNADGEMEENISSRPFFRLAKNVGLYFASQMWKTQITSVDDVKFYDLSKNVVEQSGINLTPDMFDMPGIFINPYADKTDPENYLGRIINGIYEKLNPETQTFYPFSHFYVMEYKLRDSEGSRTGKDVRKYYALVSVPTKLQNTSNKDQTRLIMYSHPGDYGVSPSDLIIQLNTKLSEYVVVAPVFPGEPLCTQMAIQTKGCLRLDDQNNIIPDNIGHFNNPYAPEIKFNSILPIDYPRSPLDQDINAFLGAHNAVSRVMNQSLNGTNPLYNASLKNNSVLLALDHPEQLINAFQDLNSELSGAKMVPTNLAPQTIGIGGSRGGGVLLAAIGRVGFFLNGASLDTQFPHSVKDDGADFEFQYPLINTAALFFTPTSILTGKLRLLAIMIMKNDIQSIASIPMVSDLVNNKYFANYRNDQNPSSQIQPVIENADGSLGQANDSLTQLATFIASNDITFLAPFVASGLQNWNSYYFEDNIRAPGSIVFFHGSQDMIVPITESTIGATALNTVWAGLYNTPMDPYGNYLSHEKFAALHPMLKGSVIPGVGVAQYTFQPTKEFFNIPCDHNMLAGIQQPEVIYNSDVNRCFGGGYSPTGDGKNAVGTFYGHNEGSFYSSTLINPIDSDLLHIAGLSSNVFDKYQRTYDFAFDADKQMRFGGPKYSAVNGNTACAPGVHDCTFPYTVPLNSPTFMRYMSDEGKLSDNLVEAKKYIFAGDFKPNHNSKIRPHQVLFSWLESVACDWCEIGNANDEPLFPSHFGVFHDFTITER